MSGGANASRTHVWLESLGDWAWPGRSAAAESVPSPPAWVPTLPPALEPAMAGALSGGSLAGPFAGAHHARRGPRARRLLIAALLCALAGVCAALALKGSLTVQGLLGLPRGGAATHRLEPHPLASPPELLEAPPALQRLSTDAAGSAIARAEFPSGSLGGEGSFLVYEPAGYATSARRYPVLYLLHGRNGHADAFLEIGIQRTLDRLIAARRIAPIIAVMVQDLPGLNNWRDLEGRHSATYVVEVQELVDRTMRTIPQRADRAIAGSSMGGFGAMNVALANPERFSVVESWLGFFNNLDDELNAARPVISRLGLHAFLYGALEDPVADPQEDTSFAAELRAAGAQAHSAVYDGGHSLEKVREHLDAMLLFAGRAMAAAI